MILVFDFDFKFGYRRKYMYYGIKDLYRYLLAPHHDEVMMEVNLNCHIISIGVCTSSECLIKNTHIKHSFSELEQFL